MESDVIASALIVKKNYLPDMGILGKTVSLIVVKNVKQILKSATKLFFIN